MDGSHVRVLARSVHEMADGVRGTAVRLSGAHGVSWTSVAADEFRARLVTQSRHVGRTAALLDDAVAALLAHAAALDARWLR